MAITVTGSTLSVTLSNATDLELGGHLTWSADNTKDVGASGANRPRTGYFGTSLVSPTLTNAGTLALSATGANVITLLTNGSERVRVTSGGKVSIATTDELSPLTLNGDITLRNVGSGNIYSNAYYDGAFRYAANGYATFVSFTGNSAGDIDFLTAAQNSGGAGATASFTSRVTIKNGGNLLVGTTTDNGASKLQVAGTASAYGATIYDPTATTGVTRTRWTPGAAQSTVPLIAATSGSALSLGINDTIYASLTSAGVFTIANDTFILTTAKTPSSAADTGTTGQIAWDANYVYVAVGANTWKRAALSTW